MFLGRRVNIQNVVSVGFSQPTDHIPLDPLVNESTIDGFGPFALPRREMKSGVVESEYGVVAYQPQRYKALEQFALHLVVTIKKE